MPKSVTLESFFNAPGPILDVRSPGEYHHAHIPGAVSFPLFTDEERAAVGTCYKQQGRDEAVELGIGLVGPKSAQFIQSAKAIAPDRRVRIHCWRGGMRSGAMGTLLEVAGFKVTLLEGGYKAFRRWARSTFSQPRPIFVLGGMTGSSKTEILHALARLGEPILDLENLANHRGSSFGALELPPQPDTEHFENLIALQWSQFDGTRPIWIEAESRRVGTCRIPEELFQQMEVAPTVEIIRPVDERLDHLVDIYGQASVESLVKATERIRKRLGGQRTQAATELGKTGDYRGAAAIILDYYDRTYRYDLERRGKVIPQVDVTGLSHEAAARKLQVYAAEHLMAALQQPRTPGVSVPSVR